MDKKELKKIEKMSMKKFLRRYYGLTNEQLLVKLSKLTHKELKTILQYYNLKMQKISFDNLTREMLASGEVILVTDKFDNPAPYINPEISLKDEYLTTLDESYVSDLERKKNENDKHKRR